MLNESQIEKFEDDGFLLGGRVCTDAEAEELAEEMQRVIRDQHRKDVPQPNRIINLAKPDAPVWQILNIWQASEPYVRLMRSPKITEEIAQLTRAAELRVWHDQIQFKPAAGGGVNMWHQDSPLWPTIEPKNEQVSAWIALDDVDEGNGCMSMVPGSYRWGHQQALLNTLTSWEGLVKECAGREVKTRLCPVRKGHVHFHHAMTWHGSHANASNRPRRAIAFHYMTDRTYYAGNFGHPMEPLITVPKETKLTGDVFPLVWTKGAAVADPTPELAAV